MTATDIHRETTTHAYFVAGQPGTSLLAVVGFDGSTPALAALEAAAQLIRGREGHLEVVYVAHLPGYASMSAQAVVGLREGFADVAAELSDEARTALDRLEVRWHFQRRNGSVVTELVAAASELRDMYGPDSSIVIIVGASEHALHHLAGSVASSLARNAGFPLLVVPVPSDRGSAPADTSEAARYLG
jgi:nucleotide-binding universal stress UspA family protein